MFNQIEIENKPATSLKSNKKQKFDIKKVKQVLTISFPEEVRPDSKKYKKRYKISLKYKDIEGKLRTKSIYFGDKGVSEYIDHKREDLREQTLGKMRPGRNLFDKEYYRYHILNGPKATILGNYTVMLNKIKVENDY